MKFLHPKFLMTRTALIQSMILNKSRPILLKTYIKQTANNTRCKLLETTILLTELQNNRFAEIQEHTSTEQTDIQKQSNNGHSEIKKQPVNH
uniref:Putative ovule protein n=1 Tax=Solanum chacoense TaxID=4108 RepID=A0A0V0H520_SOLCH